MSEILLSICICGRNDNYGHDFKRRFAQAMNLMAWSAKRANALEQIEVVFTDWNSERPLAKELILSKDATAMVRFIEVPPEIAVKHNKSLSPFQQSIAFNVALRRAKGKFLGLMPADILFTSHGMRNMIGILNGDIPVMFDLKHAVISVPRKKLPYYIQESSYFTSPAQIEKYLIDGDAYMLFDNHARGLMGEYGAFILERELLFELRGVDERIAGWGYNDIDIALRCADKADVINTSGYCVVCYDFEASLCMVRQKERRKTDFWEIKPGVADNDENWGLGNIELTESRAVEGNRAYAETSPIPESVSYRDWVIWLSQHVGSSSVPSFSSAALAVGWNAMKLKPKKIMIYGTADMSVCAAISLVCPLAELVICEHFLDVTAYEKLWKNDNLLGSFHHQAHVAYLPVSDIFRTLLADMIILNGILPAPDILKKNCSPVSVLVFLCGADKTEEYVSSLSGMGYSRICIYGITVLTPYPIALEEAQVQWKPMTGNLITKFLLMFREYFSKIRKLGNILARQPFHSWPRVFAIISKIRGGS